MMWISIKFGFVNNRSASNCICSSFITCIKFLISWSLKQNQLKINKLKSLKNQFQSFTNHFVYNYIGWFTVIYSWKEQYLIRKVLFIVKIMLKLDGFRNWFSFKKNSISSGRKILNIRKFQWQFKCFS